MTIGKARPPRNPRDDLGALAPLVDAIASRVVEQLRPLFEGKAADDIVDRKTCPYSKRWWDANVGRTFDAGKDGRRLVAKRAAVDAAFERQQKFSPRVAPAAEPKDEDEADLARAGIRLVGGG